MNAKKIIAIVLSVVLLGVSAFSIAWGVINFNKVKEARILKKNLYEASKGYVELAQLQYINGVINYLDVLDAQRGFFSAQTGLSNAIRDEQIAVVYLYKALGGGWDNLSPFDKEETKQ